MKRLIVLTGLLAFALLSSACQTIDGEGPLKLNKNSAKHLEAYLVAENGENFAYSPKAKDAYYIYCDSPGGCVFRPTYVIQKCNQYYGYSDCKRLINKNKVVWRNAGNFMPFKSEVVKNELGQYYYAPFKEEIGQIFDTRILLIDWDGITTFVRTEAVFAANGRSGKLQISDDKALLNCEGYFIYANNGDGNWNLSCTNGQTASGTIKHDQQTSTQAEINILNAKGTDNKNKSLSFHFYIDS